MTPEPPPRARLTGVDAARGLALLGMVAVHSFSATTPTGDPSITHLVAAGRSGALFAVLAGVAIAVMTGRRRVTPGPAGRAAAATLSVRAVVIGLVGVVALSRTGPAGGIAVVLPAYAVMVLLAIPLVFLSTRVVLATGAAVAVLVPIALSVVRAGLPVASGGAVLELLLTGPYPALTGIAYVAVGLGVGRMTLSSARTAAGLLGVGLGLAVLAPVTSWLLLGPLGVATAPAAGSRWLASVAPHSGSPLDLEATIGSSLAVLGAVLLLAHLPAAARRVTDAVLAPLVAAGSMTLTLSVLHAAYVGSPWSEGDSVPAFVVQVAVLLLAAVAWRRTFRRGPLEHVVGHLASRAAAAVGVAVAPPPSDAPTGPIPGRPWRSPAIPAPPAGHPVRPAPRGPAPRGPVPGPWRPVPVPVPPMVRRPVTPHR